MRVSFQLGPAMAGGDAAAHVCVCVHVNVCVI